MKDRIKQSIKIDWQKIKALQPENVKLPYNTQHLKKSLLKYGFSLPFYVWESEGEYYCIDGHHRLDVLNELIAEGHKVPKELNAVEIEAKDRKEAIEILVSVYNQRQNPFAEEYLIEFLEVENIDIQEVNIESVNVVSETIEEETVLDAIEDDFDSTPPTEAITVLGDLYEIGEHRLLCGDSTDSDAVAKLMNGQKANLSFTSPPYNAGKSEALSGNTHTTDNKYNEYNDNQTKDVYLDLLIGFTNNALLFSEYLICNIQSLAGNKIALIEYLHEYKNNIIDIVIWDKVYGQPAMAENVMNSVWEYMFFISSKEKATRAIPNANFRGTVDNIYRGKPNRNNEFSKVHAAVFPIDLPQWGMQFTKEKDIILDQFTGSGTTMVAAHQLKRKCYGIELDPKYADVIVKRMIKLDPTLNIKRNGVVIDKKEFE
jgi:DNA modification methylase